MENEFIKTYDDFLSENTCQDLIKAGDENNERIDRNRKPNFYQRNIGDLPEYAGLYEKFKVLGMDYLSELGYSDIDLLPEKYAFESLRIKIYDVGDAFDKHVDVAGHESAKRWIAFQVYLNDDFEGGQTEFDMHDRIIEPKTGRVLVFPPLWTYPHAGLPVTKGKKYILTTYFHYV